MITNKKYKVGSKKYRVMLETYSYAGGVVDDCKERRITDGCFTDESTDSFGDWDGVDSYEEALDLMRNGYKPVVEQLKKELKGVKGQGEEKRISFQNNLVGAVPIVPLAMMGVPNNMIDMKMKPIKCKVLDIYYDMTCSCGTDSKDIIENGRKLLSVIIKLEKQGYKFNLYAMQSYCGDNDGDMLCVKIKSSSQPMDLKRMSFPLTHTAFFRVIGFDWYSKTPEGKYRSGYGRGLGYKFKKTECRELIQNMFGKNATYISGSRILDYGEEYIMEEIMYDKSKNR